MSYISANQFRNALRNVEITKNQADFLRAHSSAPSRAMTATMLSNEASYKNYRAINLMYGTLGKRIGEALESKGLLIAGPKNLSLLCDFIKPNSVTNREWILIMKSEFEQALRLAKKLD